MGVHVIPARLELDADATKQTIFTGVLVESIVGPVHIEEPGFGFQKDIAREIDSEDAETFAATAEPAK